MRRALFLATSHDCAANLAGEAYLLTRNELSPILYLWENDPCVVIGRFQNPFQECDLDAMASDHVRLVRRQSGGGAVYQDRGNLCFTIIGDKTQITKERNFAMLLSALKTLGVDAQCSGRNDILIDGRKISGNAFQYTTDRFSHHGTMLVSTDVSVMSRYLHPSKAKLAGNAVQSVRSRVANLRDYLPTVTNEMVFDAFIKAFTDMYGPVQATNIDWQQEEHAKATYALFGDRASILSRTPPFGDHLSHRFPWGEVELEIGVTNGVITETAIHTDALDTSLVPLWQTLLSGVGYTKEALSEVCRGQMSQETQELLAFLISETPA